MLLTLQAKLMAQPLRKYLQAEASAAKGSKQISGSVAFQGVYGLAKAKKIRVGYGFRATAFQGKNQRLITAPAILTTGAEGPQVLFLPDRPDYFDTLGLATSSVLYVNAMFVIEYAISKKCEAGFNIDLAGLSLGADQKARYRSSKNNPGDFLEEVKASPTPWNLLLISHNDIGSLNSEIYLRYRFNSQGLIKIAYSYQFIEYTTFQPLRLGNDRFRQTPGLLAIGLAWRFKQLI